MKLLLPILLSCASAFSQTAYVGTSYVGSLTVPTNSVFSYVFTEDFEGTGYENPSAWAEIINSPGLLNEDESTTVIHGSQSLARNSAVASSTYAIITLGSGCSTLYVVGAIRYSSLTADRVVLAIKDASSNNLAYATYDSNSYDVWNGSGSPTASQSGTFSATTWYYFKMRYTKGTGSNATASFTLSSDNTFNEAAATITTGTGTADAKIIQFTSSSSNGFAWYLDWVRVSTSDPGETPE